MKSMKSTSRKNSIAGTSSAMTMPTVVATETQRAEDEDALDDVLAPAPLARRASRATGRAPAAVSVGHDAPRRQLGRSGAASFALVCVSARRVSGTNSAASRDRRVVVEQVLHEGRHLGLRAATSFLT